MLGTNDAAVEIVATDAEQAAWPGGSAFSACRRAARVTVDAVPAAGVIAGGGGCASRSMFRPAYGAARPVAGTDDAFQLVFAESTSDERAIPRAARQSLSAQADAPRRSPGICSMSAKSISEQLADRQIAYLKA